MPSSFSYIHIGKVLFAYLLNDKCHVPSQILNELLLSDALLSVQFSSKIFQIWSCSWAWVIGYKSHTSPTEWFGVGCLLKVSISKEWSSGTLVLPQSPPTLAFLLTWKYSLCRKSHLNYCSRAVCGGGFGGIGGVMATSGHCACFRDWITSSSG